LPGAQGAADSDLSQAAELRLVERRPAR